MPKILCKCALISRVPRQGEDGETAWTTHVKLTPLNIMGGDILLAFSKSDVVFHPGHELRDPKDPRIFTKQMISEESLIQEATVYVKGEKFATFKAGHPAHPGHMDNNPPVPPQEAEEPGVYELLLPEAVLAPTPAS